MNGGVCHSVSQCDASAACSGLRQIVDVRLRGVVLLCAIGALELRNCLSLSLVL